MASNSNLNCSTSAEDALQRAKAIVARLSGEPLQTAATRPTTTIATTNSDSATSNENRLSPPSVVDNATGTTSATATATATGPTATSISNSSSNETGRTSKRKRWGVTPDISNTNIPATTATMPSNNNNNNGVENPLESAVKRIRMVTTTAAATSTTSSSTASALAAAMMNSKPSSFVSTVANKQQQKTTKRIWVSVTKEKPAAHFVSYIKRNLTTTNILQPFNGKFIEQDKEDDDHTNSFNNKGKKDSADKEKQKQKDDSHSAVLVQFKGKGSSRKPPPLGMPEEPLHMLIEGYDAEAVRQVELQMDQLLYDAEQAPLEEGVEISTTEDDDTNNPANGQHASSDTNSLALLPTSSALAAISSSSAIRPTQKYRPASVAQLIGQATMPPEMAAKMAAVNAISNSNDPHNSNGGAAANILEETIGVPNGVVGYIIGRGGENISSMQAKTGCKVQIQKEYNVQPGQTQRTITLQATNQQAIDECKLIIQNMVQDRVRAVGGASSTAASATGFTATNNNISNFSMNNGDREGNSYNNTASAKDAKLQEALAAGHKLVQVDVPDADVGLIIGKMGSTIKSIQDQSGGAHIHVPTASNTDNPAVRTLSITHALESNALHAKQLIQELLQSKTSFSTNNHNNSNQQAYPPPREQVSIQVPIPDKDVGLCIGRQGCVIRHMQSTTHTRIQIPSHALPGETHRIATVTGPPDGCAQVQQMIEQIVAQQSSASILSPYGSNTMYGGFGGPPQQQQLQQPEQYAQQDSAEWAAYHAAQAAAQQQQQQQPYPNQQYYQQPHAAMASNSQTPVVASAQQQQQPPQQQYTTDTTYHEDFFRYAYYYGEDAARKHYGAWSPPPGTPNPYGINPNGIQPQPQQQPQQEQQPQQQPTPQTATGPTDQQNSIASTDARDTSRRKVSNLPAWMKK